MSFGLEDLRRELHDASEERMAQLQRAMGKEDLHMQCGVELDVFFKKNGWSVTTVAKDAVHQRLSVLPCFEKFVRQADMFNKTLKLLHAVPAASVLCDGAHVAPAIAMFYTPFYLGTKRLSRVPVSHYQAIFNNTTDDVVKPLEQLAADVEASRELLAKVAREQDAGKAEFQGGRYKEKLMAFTAPSMHINSSVWRKGKNLLADKAVFDACGDASLIMQREAPLLKLSTAASYDNFHRESFYTKSVAANKSILMAQLDNKRSLRARGTEESPYFEGRLSMADCDARLAVVSAQAEMYAGLVHAGQIKDETVARAMRHSMELLKQAEPNRLHDTKVPKNLKEARARFGEGELTRAVLGDRLYKATVRYYDAVLKSQAEDVGVPVGS